MNELTNKETKLIALSKQQLFELVYAIEKLEKDLSLTISKDLLTDQLTQAVAIKLNQMKKREVSEQGWMSIWLLIPQNSNTVTGLFEFKGPPNQEGRVEIGIGLDPVFDDIHQISEAIKNLCERAFEQPKCNLITATAVSDPILAKVFQEADFLKMAESPAGSLWHCYQNPAEIPHQITRHGFESIGVIHTTYENPSGTPIQPNAAENSLGTIIVHPVLMEGLKDLDDFSHIILLYVFDRINQPKLLVKPFMDDEERGVLATRAPARPNPIGISVVRLLRIEGNLLHFSGADILNNTPLLDIKPYVPAFDPDNVDRIGWLENRKDRLPNSFDDGRFI